jgi:hypothetical protein
MLQYILTGLAGIALGVVGIRTDLATAQRALSGNAADLDRVNAAAREFSVSAQP